MQPILRAPVLNTRTVRNARGELHERLTPLFDPLWIGAEEAAFLRPDEAVLGLELGAGAWALPWSVMRGPHFANLKLGEQPILVALCPICSNAAAFDPVIDGRRHTFRLEGAYNGTVLPLDYETASLWAGLTGEAIDGPMKGRAMQRLPLFQCTWQEWSAMHPDTLVADGRAQSHGTLPSNISPGSPVINPVLLKTLQHLDQRLPHYELVLGVTVGKHSRCYPLGVLDECGQTLNDTLGGEDIVVLHRPGSWMAAAYRRSLEGRTLTFQNASDSIVDEQTGSCWEVTGQANSGTLQGRRLEYVNSGTQEFYAWAAFHVDTDIFGYAPAANASGTAAHPGWKLEMLSAISRIVLGPKVWALAPGPKQWWHKDMRLLVIGCGDGALAAWLAEAGLNVLAADSSPVCVARAQKKFRGAASLKFEVMNILDPAVIAGKYDALIDHGVLGTLPATARAAYVSAVAAVANPAARFLLVIPLWGTDHRQFAANIKRLFQPFFDLLDVRTVSMPHPETGVPVKGAAFRFVRRQ